MQNDPTAIRTLRTRLCETTRKLLTPPPHESLAEWANNHRVIGVGAGPLPGPYQWQVAPYQKIMMDVAGDMATRKMVVCAAVQTAKTTLLENIIAYYMSNDPSPMMLVLPSERDAEIFSTTRLDTMIADTPCLQGLLRGSNAKDTGDTRFQKRFRGGSLELISAKSPSSFRGRSIRIVLMDEIDAYERLLHDEGDPVDLAAGRLTMFWDGKLVLVSTPTDLSVSRIWPEFLGGDQRYYFVPCPKCEHMQPLTFKQLKWENDDPATVYYLCESESCGYHIKHYSKHGMMMKGEWRAQAPENGYPSFHLNGLYSPVKKWSGIAAEWLKTKGDQTALRAFINLVLAEPWKPTEVQTTIGQLEDLREHYDAECPTGVGQLIAGVDVQRDRLEVAVWGFGMQEQRWYIDSHVIRHDPSTDEAWAELSALLARRYMTPSGKTIPISAAAIDSGFATDFVYRYVGNYNHPNVFAVKGSSNPSARLISRVRYSKHKRNAPFYEIGTSTAKDQIDLGFKNPLGAPRSFHFPHDVESEVLEQLLSEVKVTRWKQMRPYENWEPKTSTVRNEMLDCLVYCFAAMAFLNNYGDLDRLAQSYMKEGTVTAAPTDAPITVPTLSQAVPPPNQPKQLPKFTYTPRFKRNSGW